MGVLVCGNAVWLGVLGCVCDLWAALGLRLMSHSPVSFVLLELLVGHTVIPFVLGIVTSTGCYQSVDVGGP